LPRKGCSEELRTRLDEFEGRRWDERFNPKSQRAG